MICGIQFWIDTVLRGLRKIPSLYLYQKPLKYAVLSLNASVTPSGTPLQSYNVQRASL